MGFKSTFAVIIYMYVKIRKKNVFQISVEVINENIC